MPGTFRVRADVSLAMQGQRPDPLTFDRGTSVDEGFSYTFQLADGTSNESFIVIGAAGGIETVTCLAIVADQAISLTLGTTGANVPIVMTPGEPVILQGIILGAASVSNASGNTANVTVLLAGSGDVVAPSPGTLTTFTGNVRINASNAKLFIRDSDGPWGTAIPTVQFEDNAGTVGGSLAFDGAQDFVLSQTLPGQALTLSTNGGIIIADTAIRISTANARILLRDTSGAWGVADPGMEFEDSSGTAGGSITFDTNQDMFLSNTLFGHALTLSTNSGIIIADTAIRISTANARILLKDTSGTWGVADPGVEFEDSSGTVGGSITFDTNQDMFLSNTLFGHAITLSTNSGIIIADTNVRISTSGASIVLKDVDGIWGTAAPSVSFEDSAQTEGGSLAFDTAQDLLLTNGRSGGNIELVTTGGGDFVLTTLPTSDPVVAGALWNNSGVVNVSAG